MKFTKAVKKKLDQIEENEVVTEVETETWQDELLNVKIRYEFDLSVGLQEGYNLDTWAETEPEVFFLEGKIEISEYGERESQVSIRDYNRAGEDVGDVDGYQIDYPFDEIQDTAKYLDKLNEEFQLISRHIPYENIRTLASYETSRNIFQNQNLDLGTRFDQRGLAEKIYYRKYNNESLNPGHHHPWNELGDIQEYDNTKDIQKAISYLFGEELNDIWKPSFEDLNLKEAPGEDGKYGLYVRK